MTSVQGVPAVLVAVLTPPASFGARVQDPNSTFHHIHRLLAKHKEHIREDKWKGLPELTNENGAYCHDSCDTQAWSTSTILDVLDDIRLVGRE